MVVQAAHNRTLEQDPNRLWEKLENQPVQGYKEVELSETKTRKGRSAKLAVCFYLVQLRSPARLALQVYAVYAYKMDCTEGEEPVSWMLLTSEPVTGEFSITPG
ncbi:MAG: hypothetical protein F6K24_50920 [Okeania sp. SIO2D1]|nr:hypothetical protein [Okeania sp. SIO2D1]